MQTGYLLGLALTSSRGIDEHCYRMNTLLPYLEERRYRVNILLRSREERHYRVNASLPMSEEPCYRMNIFFRSREERRYRVNSDLPSRRGYKYARKIGENCPRQCVRRMDKKTPAKAEVSLC